MPIVRDDQHFIDTTARATRVAVISGGSGGGGLTDAELRATPVPVTTDGLTDAELRAAPVPVSGTVTATPPASVQRVTAITRVATATTTAITAGKKSYSVAVVTAASVASPTLDGVALPAGATVSFTAPDNDTLEAASVVTVSGDDVIITSVT
jgi:hypothetical protein